MAEKRKTRKIKYKRQKIMKLKTAKIDSVTQAAKQPAESRTEN